MKNKLRNTFQQLQSSTYLYDDGVVDLERLPARGSGSRYWLKARH